MDTQCKCVFLTLTLKQPSSNLRRRKLPPLTVCAIQLHILQVRNFENYFMDYWYHSIFYKTPIIIYNHYIQYMK